jgi:YHS domain-containing protein
MIPPRLFSCLLFAALAIVVVGCKPPAANKQNPSAPLVSQSEKQPADAEASKETAADASTKSLPGLADLSVEDRQIAEKQHTCPVSGEVLDSMGKPFKVSAEGKTIFLCCEGCLQQFKENPEKYLAKLKKIENK